MIVKKVLREIRRAKEVSQKDLGKKMGVKDPTVCAWESGRINIKAQQFVDALAILGKKIVIEDDFNGK